jgi:hypothetical protein
MFLLHKMFYSAYRPVSGNQYVFMRETWSVKLGVEHREQGTEENICS